MKVVTLYYPHWTKRASDQQEDAFAADKKQGVFAVADGVHLFRGLEYGRKYPRPSPAGELARLFCRNFLRYARRMNLRRAFVSANASLGRINKKRKYFPTAKNRLKVAATASFCRIRGRILEWGLICDSGVAVINKKGNLRLLKQDHAWHSDFDLSKFDDSAQMFFTRTVFRNALLRNGERAGYGVLTGERATEKYARFGKLVLNKGDIAAFFTDGFEFFMKDKNFRKALVSFNKENIEWFVRRKIKTGGVEFKKEKTLTLIKLD